MQKWSPEPFDTPAPTPTPAAAAPVEFETASAVFGSTTASATASQFRSESGFTDTKSLMNSLTPEERSQVYELVQMDVADEYEEREQKLREEFEQRLDNLASSSEKRFANWADQIAETLAREVRGASDAAAALAIQIAGKIVRRTVAVDPEILVRTIEATIFKIAANEPLTIQANTEDAEWLKGQTELLERLHIGEVVADRRVEPGGCLIQCQGREWDATLGRQLGSLEDIVTEMLATAEPPTPLEVPDTASGNHGMDLVDTEPEDTDPEAVVDTTPDIEAPDDPGLA